MTTATQNPVKLELVEIDNPPYCYVEDVANPDDEGEGMLYTVKEFVETILSKKATLSADVATQVLKYLHSGDMDQERDVKYLAKAYNLAHGLVKA